MEKDFIYEIQRGGGSLFIFRELSWFEKMKYRLTGHKVIKITPEELKAYCDDGKKTTVGLEIKI